MDPGWYLIIPVFIFLLVYRYRKIRKNGTPPVKTEEPLPLVKAAAPLVAPPVRDQVAHEGTTGMNHEPDESGQHAVNSAEAMDPANVQKVVFEKYIAQKLEEGQFTMKLWRGLKTVNGQYEEGSRYPDMELEFNSDGTHYPFALECKYRPVLDSDPYPVCRPDQLLIYSRFSSEKNMDVYILLGVGPWADNPEELYLIPCPELSSHLVSRGDLENYRKIDRSFAFVEGRLV